jgi:hypothetical protein
MTEKECASIITKGRVPDGLSGPRQCRDPSLGAARERLASLPQDVKRDGFSGILQRALAARIRSEFPAGPESGFCAYPGLTPWAKLCRPSGGWIWAAVGVSGAGGGLVVFDQRRCRASLGWTAGGGCPHGFDRALSGPSLGVPGESAEIRRESLARERLRCLRMTWVLAGGIRS